MNFTSGVFSSKTLVSIYYTTVSPCNKIFDSAACDIILVRPVTCYAGLLLTLSFRSFTVDLAAVDPFVLFVSFMTFFDKRNFFFFFPRQQNLKFQTVRNEGLRTLHCLKEGKLVLPGVQSWFESWSSSIIFQLFRREDLNREVHSITQGILYFGWF